MRAPEENKAVVNVDVRSSLLGSARKEAAPIQWPSVVSQEAVVEEEEKDEDNSSRPLPSSSTHVD